MHQKTLVRFTALGGLLAAFGAPGVASALSASATNTSSAGPIQITVTATLGSAITLWVEPRSGTLLSGSGAIGSIAFGSVTTDGVSPGTGYNLNDTSGSLYIAELRAYAYFTGYDSLDVNISGTATANFDGVEEQALWQCYSGSASQNGTWTSGPTTLAPGNGTPLGSPGANCATFTTAGTQGASTGATDNNSVFADLAFYFADSAETGSYSATYNFTAYAS